MSFFQETGVRALVGETIYDLYITTNLYVERSFGRKVIAIIVTNDSDSDEVQLSFDGATIKATVKPQEILKLSVPNVSSIYVKATTGGGEVRIWSA